MNNFFSLRQVQRMRSFVTFFIDPATGQALTELSVALVDPRSGVVVLPEACARVLSGHLVQMGSVVDCDPHTVVNQLSPTFLRFAFADDETRRTVDVERLRDDLRTRLTMIPDEIAGQPYIVNHRTFAFPVVSRNPVILRDGDATLTLYEVFTPRVEATKRHLMPHMLRSVPHMPVQKTVFEVLRQYFPDVKLRHLDTLETRPTKNESVMHLTMMYPLTLHDAADLRTLSV